MSLILRGRLETAYWPSRSSLPLPPPSNTSLFLWIFPSRKKLRTKRVEVEKFVVISCNARSKDRIGDSRSIVFEMAARGNENSTTRAIWTFSLSLLRRVSESINSSCFDLLLPFPFHLPSPFARRASSTPFRAARPPFSLRGGLPRDARMRHTRGACLAHRNRVICV